MVAARIKGVKVCGPKLFFASLPDYPLLLKAANLKGQAMVAIHIGTNGAVNNAVLRSATVPCLRRQPRSRPSRCGAFFLTIKDDHPVETQAIVPFTFEQPKKS